MEHWNTHFAQSSSGPPDHRRRRGVTEGVWRRSLRWHLSLTCFKSVVVSVPVFQPGDDLGGSRWKPAQRHTFRRFQVWNPGTLAGTTSVPGCSSVPAVGQLGQLVKAAGTGRGNLRARTARSRGFDRHHQIRSGSLVFHQQAGRPASTDRGPGRRSCG